MVNWSWLIFTFILGANVGFILAALANMARGN